MSDGGRLVNVRDIRVEPGPIYRGGPGVRVTLDVECDSERSERSARDLVDQMRQGAFTPRTPLEEIVTRTYKMYQSGANLEDAVKAAIVTGELQKDRFHDHNFDPQSQSVGPRGFTSGVPQPGSSIGPDPYGYGRGRNRPPGF